MSGITKSVLGFAFFLVCFSLPMGTHANSIAPEAFDLNLQPGESDEYVLSIFNNETNSVSYRADVVGMMLDQNGGDIDIGTDGESVKWIQLSESSFVLDPGEEKQLTVRAAIPENTDAQVASLGIRVLEAVPASGGIGIASGFISLLFMTVEGDLEESYEILAFETSDQIITTLPVTFTFTIRNNGERIVQPNGTIEFVDMFGKTVWSAEVNEDNYRVLSEGVRAFSSSMGDDETGFLLPGIYKVKLQAAAWPLGEEFAQELTVVYLPWRGLILVGLVFAAFFLILKKLNVSRRRL